VPGRAPGGALRRHRGDRENPQNRRVGRVDGRHAVHNEGAPIDPFQAPFEPFLGPFYAPFEPLLSPFYGPFEASPGRLSHPL